LEDQDFCTKITLILLRFVEPMAALTYLSLSHQILHG